MFEKAYLILEDGTVFEGNRFGARKETTGEVVFATGMAGYLKTLTDLSYSGKIVLQTFPLVGNYGVIPEEFESDCIGPAAYIVKYPCENPSNFRSEGKLGNLLLQRGVVGLCGIDTRKLAKVLRLKGVMNGRITHEKPNFLDTELLKQISAFKPLSAGFSLLNKKLYHPETSERIVALIDFGARHSIRKTLASLGCGVWVLPPDTSPEEILSLSDGIVIAGGSENPVAQTDAILNVKSLIASDKPILGIGLGHELLALANGFKTRKMKYGHRGENQPVKDAETGRVYITAQNHGCEVVSESIDKDVAREWFINLNDGANEGILYKNAPRLSVQFLPGDRGLAGTEFVYKRFIEYMEAC